MSSIHVMPIKFHRKCKHIKRILLNFSLINYLIYSVDTYMFKSSAPRASALLQAIRITGMLVETLRSPVSSVLFFWTVHRSDPNVKEILCVHSSTEHLGQHGFIGLQANAHVCVCAVHAFVAKLIAAPVELMAKRQSTKQCDPCVNITNVWFRTQKATNNNFGNFPSFLFVEKKVFFQWIGNQLVCK